MTLNYAHDSRVVLVVAVVEGLQTPPQKVLPKLMRWRTSFFVVVVCKNIFIYRGLAQITAPLYYKIFY